MKLFSKKEKEETTLDDTLEKDVAIYLDYIKDIYFINNMKYSSEDKEIDANEYRDAINYFKEYLESKYTDDLLDGSNVLNIDEEDMLREAPKYAYNLFKPVKYSELIYINDDTTFPHMHTDGEKVIEMEGIHILPGLDRCLQIPKLNDIFKGFTVNEAATLIKQMNIQIKENGELNKALFCNRVNKLIRSMFFKDIVYALLIPGTKESIVRARLFADTYGIDFNFNAYIRNNEKQKKLKLEKTDANV